MYLFDLYTGCELRKEIQLLKENIYRNFIVTNEKPIYDPARFKVILSIVLPHCKPKATKIMPPFPKTCNRISKYDALNCIIVSRAKPLHVAQSPNLFKPSIITSCHRSVSNDQHNVYPNLFLTTRN